MTRLTVIGGGLAGSEAAWQAAQLGIDVDLYEMRPSLTTGAHRTEWLAELVCSNSFGSQSGDHAAGVLLRELRLLGSLLAECAEARAVPAGTALAVDRESFAQQVTARIQYHPRIRLIREEVTRIPDSLTIIASGPLTSPALSEAIVALTGRDHLYFFDAIAPIVWRQTINMDRAYYGSRYEHAKGAGDYINCPLDRDQYYVFVHELLGAERIALRAFEAAVADGVSAGRFFEGCLPIEILAERGPDSLAFGPMRPVGLDDPRTGRRPYAVVQLRQDNLAGNLLNIVGFQTNLKYAAQREVFHLIPGLERAEFARYGQMHRNTFIASPGLLRPTMQFSSREHLFFAGQIVGVEGYLGNIGTGLLAGINAAKISEGQEPLELPPSTMLGALCHYVTHAHLRDFQPMKANFGILPELEGAARLSKAERGRAYAARAAVDLDQFLEQVPA